MVCSDDKSAAFMLKKSWWVPPWIGNKGSVSICVELSPSSWCSSSWWWFSKISYLFGLIFSKKENDSTPTRDLDPKFRPIDPVALLSPGGDIEHSYIYTTQRAVLLYPFVNSSICLLFRCLKSGIIFIIFTNSENNHLNPNPRINFHIPHEILMNMFDENIQKYFI